jgi:hypothetical protein
MVLASCANWSSFQIRLVTQAKLALKFVNSTAVINQRMVFMAYHRVLKLYGESNLVHDKKK